MNYEAGRRALPFLPLSWEEWKCKFPTLHAEWTYSYQSEKKNLNSKSREILFYAFLGSITRKGWKIWSTAGSVTQALLSSMTTVHKTHFEDSLASLFSLCSQLPPAVPQLSSRKLFIWLQLCFGRVKGEKTYSTVEALPTFMHYLLYQSYKLWERSLVIKCCPILMTVQIAHLHTVTCIWQMWSNCC